MAKPCSDCGSSDIQWAHNKKKDGTWGPMLFSSIPGGEFKSYEISEVNGKAQAKFVLSKDQVHGVDYYAAHYKVCGKGSQQARPSAPASRQDSAGNMTGSATIGGTVYDITLTERLPF